MSLRPRPVADLTSLSHSSSSVGASVLGPSNKVLSSKLDQLDAKLDDLNQKLELVLQKVEVTDMRIRTYSKPPPPKDNGPRPGDVPVTREDGFV